MDRRSNENDAPTAIVTGGASGIGRALAGAIARTGATVIVADRQIELARSVAADITSAGGRARAEELDVRDRAQFAAVVESAIGTTGRLDFLFNNAGIAVLGEAVHYGDRDWADVVDVNLSGVCNGIAAAYPVMVRAKAGHIVNTASLAGLIPAPLIASYTASKFGVVGLSRALRLEAARYGVRVTVVCPFITDTPLLSGGRYGRINADAGPLERRRSWLDRFSVSPDDLATRVLRDVRRNRAIVVHPTWARVLWQLDRVNPWVAERLSSALLKRLIVR